MTINNPKKMRTEEKVQKKKRSDSLVTMEHSMELFILAKPSWNESGVW